MVTLGISLGTTTAGIAILSGRELIHWRTHSFRAVWSDTKADVIAKRLYEYIDRYHVQVVVIKLPPASHQSCPVRQLLGKVHDMCKTHGCVVQTITRKDIRIAIPDIRNNTALMRYVIAHYPPVVPHYEQALKRKNHYHKKLFEAIAVAHIASTKGG
jgi:RNase H-fold protein (predicted Holliday junction resolvase)